MAIFISPGRFFLLVLLVTFFLTHHAVLLVLIDDVTFIQPAVGGYES